MKKLFETQDEIKDYLRQRGYKTQDRNKFASLLFKDGPIDKEEAKRILNFHFEVSNRKEGKSEYKLETNTILLSEIIKNIEKEIKPIRIKLFENEDPPFSNFRDAVMWIDAEMTNNPRKETNEKYELYDKAIRDINLRIDKGEIYGDHLYEPLRYGVTFKKEINKEGCSIKQNVNYFFLKTENGYIYKGSHFVYHSEKLLYLTERIKEVSCKYRIDEYELLNLFMCGTAPGIKRWETLLHVVDGKKSKFEIIINSPDLTLIEIKKIYNDYRDAMNVKSKKNFNSKQERIIDLINKVGEPPQKKGRSDYFKELMIHWNSKYPDEKYTDWKTLYKAYNTIQDSLRRMEV